MWYSLYYQWPEVSVQQTADSDSVYCRPSGPCLYSDPDSGPYHSCSFHFPVPYRSCPYPDSPDCCLYSDPDSFSGDSSGQF